ncbi:hypothetical protein C0995_010228 [Termitomyces sp. Mi166|nr:hypothetical protein C0995_010228 [Termitomyces sp. Mi166\
MKYKDTIELGFYELQSVRDWYREVTCDVGIDHDLIRYWTNASFLIITLSCFTSPETSTLPFSDRLPRFSSPTKSIEGRCLHARDDQDDLRCRGVTAQDAAKVTQDAAKVKGKKGPADPRPEAAEECADIRGDGVPGAVKDTCNEQTDKVDDTKVKVLPMERGLIKNKRAM